MVPYYMSIFSESCKGYCALKTGAFLVEISFHSIVNSGLPHFDER